MRESVKKSIKQSHDQYKDDDEFKRHEWVLLKDHITQGICTVGSIIWCQTTEATFAGDEDENNGEVQTDTQGNLEWWLSENIEQLTELTKLVST